MTHGFVFPGELVGGHEMMAAKVVRALHDEGRALVILSSPTLYQRLQPYIGVALPFKTVTFKTFRFESFLGYVNPNYWRNKVAAKQVVSGLSSATLVVGGVNAHQSAALALGQACRELGIISKIYIPMFHNPNEMGVNAVKGWSNIQSARRIFNVYSRVLTIDEYWAQRVATFAQRPQLGLDVIHNFLKLPFVPSPANTERITSGQGKRICVVGRMEKEQKGLDHLLRVLGALAPIPDLPVHTWVFIGDGPYLPDIKQFAQRNANPQMRFEFCGWRKDSVQIMSTCNALALTSRWEGVPTVVAEALLLSLQVFAFDIAGIDRLLFTDERVPCFDANAYARRLVSFLTQETALRPQARPYLDMICNVQRFRQEVSAIYA